MNRNAGAIPIVVRVSIVHSTFDPDAVDAEIYCVNDTASAFSVSTRSESFSTVDEEVGTTIPHGSGQAAFTLAPGESVLIAHVLGWEWDGHTGIEISFLRTIIDTVIVKSYNLKESESDYIIAATGKKGKGNTTFALKNTSLHPAIRQGNIMLDNPTTSLTAKVLALQDRNGCWNVLDKSDKHFPALNYYVPNYRSTLWTMILLAEIQCDPGIVSLKKPLQTMADHFYDKKATIFSLGKTHFPIPCLNGNMLYLLSYFKAGVDPVIAGIVDFFDRYQRFDDGDFKTPSSFPYHSNRSCYGKHTCYWGIIKLLKGLSFIPKNRRSTQAKRLIEKCIHFVLLHNVCYRSHDDSTFLHTNIKKLTFPNMYQADFLEILWLLKREKVQSVHMDQALNLLKSRMQPDATWKIERRIQNLIVPVGNEFVTRRAGEVMEYCGT